jgi:RNA polymerase sigma-70 factor (ECF subfamily)
MNDAEAVARARAGDGEGFRTLVERHGRALFRLGYRMTGNEHDAEDVVQETLLRAFRRLDQWDERARFSTWLYRIAANCAYDVLRARKRRDEEPLPEAAEGGGPGIVPAAAQPSPHRLAESAEIRARMLGVLSREKAGPTLVSLCRESKDPAVRRAALQALFLQQNDQALAEVARKEKDPSVRRDAVRYLSLLGSSLSREFLSEVLDK